MRVFLFLEPQFRRLSESSELMNSAGEREYSTVLEETFCSLTVFHNPRIKVAREKGLTSQNGDQYGARSAFEGVARNLISSECRDSPDRSSRSCVLLFSGRNTIGTGFLPDRFSTHFPHTLDFQGFTKEQSTREPPVLDKSQAQAGKTWHECPECGNDLPWLFRTVRWTSNCRIIGSDVYSACTRR